MPSRPKLQHALDAAALGLPVFPQAGKIPGIKNWPENASLKPSVIERWWARRPNADIGIALPADIYVLDADGKEAMDAIYELEADGVIPAETLTMRTQRGEHRYFRVPHKLARMTVKPNATGLRLIEGKGSPGPVTWAGSVNAKTGHVYTIKFDAPIEWMPGELVREIGPPRHEPGAGEATHAEREAWLSLHAHMTQAHVGAYFGFARELLADARMDMNLTLRTLESELPHMPTGWADRFFRAGAYLGPHVASGGLHYDAVTEALEAMFTKLDTQGGSPEHVTRSIARGLAIGARDSNL